MGAIKQKFIRALEKYCKRVSRCIVANSFFYKFVKIIKMSDDQLVKQIADILIIKCPTYDSFFIGDIISEIEPEDKREQANTYHDKIAKYLTAEGYMHRPPNRNLRYILSDKGKAAKSQGGIIKFEKNERYKILRGKWYNFGKDYFLVGISIFISIISYLNSIDKDLEIRVTELENKNIELEKMNAQNLEELKELKLIKNKNNK